MEKLWNEFINYIATNQKEFATRPKTNCQPKWFRATVDIQKNCIYITNAKEHNPSSKIKIPRKLGLKDFKKIYPLHIRRESGERVSKEAGEATVNQVYFFSLLHDFLENQ